MFDPKKAVTFLKKSNQKPFADLGALAPPAPQPAVNRRFLFLFFKKEALADLTL
jgi:hypothetical protein